MLRRTAFVTAIATLSACNGPGADYSGSYVGGDDQALMQLNIVDTGEGQISGSLAISTLNYSAGKVKLMSLPVSGVRAEEQFSLLADGAAAGVKDTPLSLQVDGDALKLFLPVNGQTLEMQRMGQDEYRERLATFAQALSANDVGLVPES